MYIKKIVKIVFLIIILVSITFIFYQKFLKKNNETKILNQSENEDYNSNIIENVEYSSKDKNGNNYVIKALKGEIDISEPNILFLTKVNAIISIENSDDIRIASDFGKYNSENFDTIFSKNVKINYTNHEITGDYLDFSLKNNLMFISKNVIYKNEKNIMKSDVIEVDIQTKDTKIFMYKKNNKVNIKNY